MDRPPRKTSEGVINRDLLARAWGWMGLVSAALVLAGFFSVLLRAGWSPGDAVGVGTPLHEAYVRATAMTFAGIVACQVGTAIAARTERASLRSVGLFSNPMLIGGIAFELVFAAAVIYVPSLQPIFHTAPLGAVELATLAPFPDRGLGRRRAAPSPPPEGVFGPSVVGRKGDRCGARCADAAFARC